MPSAWNVKLSFLRWFWTEFQFFESALSVKNIFIHKKSWIDSKSFLRLSRGKFRWPFGLYFIVSFSLVDHFDDFYRWQFVSIFFLAQLDCLPHCFLSPSEIPFFSIFLRLQNILQIFFSCLQLSFERKSRKGRLGSECTCSTLVNCIAQQREIFLLNLRISCAANWLISNLNMSLIWLAGYVVVGLRLN